MTATRTIRFAKFQTELVRSGTKRMTIRKPRKGEINAGDTLRLMGPIWAGRATRAEPLLLREAVCVGVHPVVLHFSAKTSALFGIDIGGPPFDCPLSVDSFAQADGFADALEMGRYFVKWHGPGRFRGVLIRW